MPHATLPSPGFQAVILCGPGVSMNTFTSNPKDFPKALIPIANRPMVWYPLEWCYRMGVIDITLIAPPESEAAIEAALQQNPHLTSLPAPKPDIIAPKNLTQTTGTAEIFRLPEVKELITKDFVVLPCDLICELDGTSLLQSWMMEEAGFGGATGGKNIRKGIGGESVGRRGGLGVWYPTKGPNSVKKEETDFIITIPLSNPVVPPPETSLRNRVSKLVSSMTADTMKDVMEEKRGLPLRHSLLQKHGQIKMQSSHRPAHVYFFPYWVLAFINANPKLESLGEDVLGWWAKSSWQNGLGEKLGLREILQLPSDDASEDLNEAEQALDQEVDIPALSSTRTAPSTNPKSLQLASRVKDPSSGDPAILASPSKKPLIVPPILAYIQPTSPDPLPEKATPPPLIHRVDTAPLLLNISLRLAKLPSLSSLPKSSVPNPYSHTLKVADNSPIPSRCRVEADDSLLAENVTVEETCAIKESVVGPNCHIGTGAKLNKCLLMDGATVGEYVQLTGCILGRRCKIEGGPKTDQGKTVLQDCEVQEGYVVPWGTTAKNEKYMVFEGYSDEGSFEEDDDIDEADADDDTANDEMVI
ncbi:eukaryotic translation initiation factor-like protein subunit eIF2B-gamma [Aulographum hederae CBS 113979]|uniref:Mannose-1-phosphate guanyltransferase n=1 Tax=Aulographum hederae CBS 113979 TaxID=1176131 RepID=A0A6G1H1E6_9PEZI|nr:eukaryotic translation initiation factor-like protein subunit eIF2B-gamma [Aulographum hederae CBS 113979]